MIAMAIESSTLNVERKHNLDRRSEAPRVSSVSKASRDAFVRQWRTESRATAPSALGKYKAQPSQTFPVPPAAPAALGGVRGGAQGGAGG